MFRFLCALLAGGVLCLAQTPDTVVPASAPTAATAPTLAYVPLSRSERTGRYLKSLAGPEAFARAAMGAAILQAIDTPYEWGQGAEGYGRRFGNSYAEHIIRQTLTYGAAGVLDEDNRYFRSERSGVGPRTMYAIESTFLTRRHDGTRRLSYSRIGGVIATAFISREWQPRSTNGAQNAATSMAGTFGSEVGFNILREFLPNLLHHHR